MSNKLTKDFLSLIPLGSKLIIKDSEDGDFEGILSIPITFESSKTFTVTLDRCRRVGGRDKYFPKNRNYSITIHFPTKIFKDFQELIIYFAIFLGIPRNLRIFLQRFMKIKKKLFCNECFRIMDSI